METRTLLLSFMTLVIIGVVVIVIYELVIGGAFSGGGGNPITPQKTSVLLIGPLHSGQDSITVNTPLPPSMNEEDGIEFSFASWILIKDYGYGTSETPVIYKNGPGCPTVSFNVHSNTLFINQQTYKGSETIRIRNMPAEKLFHLAVCVNQTALDVYVNGLLHTHKSLDSLPLQNPGPVLVGPNGGWKGKIGSFIYYNYALSPGEIRALALTKAIRDPNDLPPNPPYFDTSWWIGRLSK
uniref:Lectin/glucanase superfamily protein n=1 Tax=viral metagenome TaxID=1070528 RepID=A0A6C0I7Z6_9ZZZZ